jgi:excisionase family DNA binding protein
VSDLTTARSIARPVELVISLPAPEVEALANRVAELMRQGRDDGFLNVQSAARFLSTTPKSIYHLVERHQLPHHRAGGRLLFDPSDLRAWVESR